MTGDYRRPSMLRLTVTAASPARDPQPAARGPAPRGQADRAGPARDRAARCAACSSTRPRSSRATTCSCSSAATARSTRRCSSELAYERPRAVRVLGARGVARAQRGPADPPLRDAAGPRRRRVARRAARGGTSEAEFRAHILERLTRGRAAARARHRGPRDRRRGSRRGWTNARNVARMLDLMWVRGQRRHRRREGAQRVWDLMERCLPPDAPDEELGDEEVTRRAAPLAVRALGAGRAPHIRAHFTRGRYPDLPSGAGGAARAGARADRGRGPRRRLVDPRRGRRDARATTSAGRTALLSPFDNLLCDRARTERCSASRHRLEIYTPKAKRRWGYFVLPDARRRPARRPRRPGDGPQAQHARRARHPREPDAPRGKACRARSGASSSGSRRGGARTSSRCTRSRRVAAGSRVEPAPCRHPRLPDELKAFLAEPNPSVIATLTPKGEPHSAATWYLWDDGRVLVNMAATRKRLEHMRRDPHVSLTVLDKEASGTAS